MSTDPKWALMVLEEIANDPKSATAARVQACTTFLRHCQWEAEQKVKVQTPGSEGSDELSEMRRKALTRGA